MKKLSPKVTWPAALLLLSSTIALAMFSLRSAPESNRPATPAPLVHTVEVKSSQIAFTVKAQGTVTPRTETDLATEVAGRIIWMSPQLLSGNFFAADEALLRIDPRDHQASVDTALAKLTRARSLLQLSRARLERERAMRGKGAASLASLDEAKHAEQSATAGLREAEVSLRRARLDLERCEIRAPFEGRVREKFADIGQYVQPGTRIARVYSVDYAEIRLPISNDELAFLDLPLGQRRSLPVLPDPEADSQAEPTTVKVPAQGPEVILSARFAGKRHHWLGHVVRTEGALDPETRMVTVVARVDDPYGTIDAPQYPPLTIGLFVDAEIQGREMAGLVTIPRAAIRADDRVAVVRKANQLDLRKIEIVRAGSEQVWIRSGLEVGERIVISPLPMAITGMAVRSVPASPLQTAASESTDP